MEVVGFMTSCLLWKGLKHIKQDKSKECHVSKAGAGSSSASAYESLVGKTPLVKLRKASELTGCDIFVKMENMNPGESFRKLLAKHACFILFVYR